LLAELGIGVTAYGVLSRGLLSGSRPASQGDFRAYLPRFTGENRERNRAIHHESHQRKPSTEEARAARFDLGPGSKLKAGMDGKDVAACRIF
jgi:aryl-alcohol dehydrogenase-like predicted oxidoreductase